MLISVIIPSRLQVQPQKSTLWLERALESISQQTVHSSHQLEVIVGLDRNVSPPTSVQGVRFVNGDIALQANVLNVAVREAQGEVLAFLEDDDIWQPPRLEVGLMVIDRFDVITANQLEVNEVGEVLEINDFATPSGWMMRHSTWDRLGPLDESYRYHLDNEYLGRMAMNGISRAHLVECEAELRPWLAKIAKHSAIVRTIYSEPLVIRTRNLQGGMARIAAGGEAGEISQMEYERLIKQYGRIPF